MVRDKDRWKSWRAGGFLEREREDLKEVESNGKQRRGTYPLGSGESVSISTTGVRNTWGVLFPRIKRL